MSNKKNPLFYKHQYKKYKNLYLILKNSRENIDFSDGELSDNSLNKSKYLNLQRSVDSRENINFSDGELSDYSLNKSKYLDLQTGGDAEERKQRIINNLQIKTEKKDKYQSATLVDRLKHYKIPGISIAVINNGKIDWADGFGVKEYGKKEKVTKNTLFQAGSISKPIFAFGVMKLKENGVIDLDKNINEYLTSWKLSSVNNWNPVITLRQLLNHTAGLTIHGFPGYKQSDKLPSVEQILNGEPPANTQPVITNNIPGINFEYSGGGTTVAQLAIMNILKKPFPLIMNELVFKPLNLNCTYEQPLPKKRVKETTSGHDINYEILDGKYHIYPEMAAAGLWTTPTDLALIVIEIQNALKGKSNFISKSTAKEMLTPSQIESDIGIGFFFSGSKNNILFEHSGVNEGFQSMLKAYKHVNKGAIIMINALNQNDIIEEVFRAIAIEYEWPDYISIERTYIKISKNMIKDYVGTYRSDKGVFCKITSSENKLFLTYDIQNPIEIKAETTTKFYLPDFNIEIQLTVDHLSLIYNDKTDLFKKQ